MNQRYKCVRPTSEFVDNWEDRVATCVAHLRSALLILDGLASHPESALEDALTYDLAARATCVALVSLDDCQPATQVTAKPRKMRFPFQS
jgi:hypothetical protein